MQKRPRVVVLGESVLDIWWSGSCQRLCPEGPAPVVEVEDCVIAPGAAANTAANLAVLGAHVEIVSAVGDDDAGRSLREEMRCYGVETTHLITTGGTTPTKQRIRAGEHVLLRIDRGDGGGSAPSETALLAAGLESALRNAEALVVSDYRRSYAHRPVLDMLRRARTSLSLVVVDAHHLGRWRDLYPDVVTPNESEATALLLDCGAAPRGRSRIDFFGRHRHRLARATGADAVVVTLDGDGVLLLDGDRPAYHTQTRQAPAQNCAGAGDTFTAAMTVGLLAGLTRREAVDYAQSAADVVTAQPGTSVCSPDQIQHRFEPVNHPAISHDQLARRVAGHRSAGQRIVFTNGCFDVLHSGHVAYLNEAKTIGDVLIVAINSDDGIRKLKGPDRPVNTARDRAAVLSALGCVDYVTVFDGNTPAPLIQRLRPDIYAKGGDYTVDMLSEAAVVRRYGGEVRILGYVPDHSTTELIQRVRGDDIVRASAGPAG